MASFVWDPDRNIFIIPYINHPVTWYGFLFALGFFISFFLIRRIFTEYLGDQKEASKLTDRLAFLVVVCAIIGARLGHVFFYDWPYYKAHPLAILKVWEGGLASHGSALGILVALIIFVYMSRAQKPKVTFLVAMDALVIPVAFAGSLIRFGNFINQELTGIPTNVFWAVRFMHPVDGFPGVAVHPVQLYESFFYLVTFCVLFFLWKTKKTALGKGALSGVFFLLVFGFRFLVDYLKVPQNEAFDANGWIVMGQVLSVPFILLGLFLLIRYFYVRKRA